jgi:putative transposase
VNLDSVKTILCYKYRLYPTKAQAAALDTTLDTLRLVYNSLLNERKFLYETTGKGISQYGQEKHFADWRKKSPELKDVHSHLLQNVALRVNLAFTAFFRRVKAGETPSRSSVAGKTPGFPRFKGVGQYDSFCFKEWGNGVSFKSGNLSVSKIGEIKCRVHRPLIGAPKTACIRRMAGKWFVCIACEVGPELLEPSEETVGIDVGLKTFAALSNGEFIDNPRFFRKEEKALAKAGRKQARTKKRSPARREANKVLARIHERVRNRRHDFCHQNARRIVNRYGVIAVEKLNVKGMVENHSLAKSISDVAWSQFRSVLTDKAERAGREVHAVNPAYTSQDCHACGYRAKKKLSERWHLCPMCGASLDRDTNAAINILQLATG